MIKIMKRLLLLIFAVSAFLLSVGRASAQHNYGFIGGVTFSQTSVKDLNAGPMTQYHAGITYRARLPHGFSIQPALIYNVKGAKTDVADLTEKVTVGYLELPVSFQWGPDLILFRPFLDITPFVGYGLNNKYNTSVTGDVINCWDGVARWEYGVGTGVGMDIWKMQFIARYNWNLGGLSKDGAVPGIAQMFKDGANLGGVTLSLSFLF